MLSFDRLKADRDKIKAGGGDTTIVDRVIESHQAKCDQAAELLQQRQKAEWEARQ